MPVKYRNTSATRIFFKLKPVKRVYYKYVQVFLAGWITHAVVTWSIQSRPSKKEVPNPAHATWLEGRPPYVTAYNKAKRAYDEWLLREPTKTETNPAYTAWLIDKKPYDDKVKQKEDDYSNWIASNPEPEDPNPEWVSWGTEQTRLDNIAAEKLRIRDEWLEDNPEPQTKLNPKWVEWNTEYTRLKKKKASAKSTLDSATRDYESKKSAYNTAKSAADSAKGEYDRAVASGAPPSVTGPLYTIWQNKVSAANAAYSSYQSALGTAQSANTAYQTASTAVTEWEGKEPQKYVTPPEHAEWAAKWNELNGAYHTAKAKADAHKQQEPDKHTFDWTIWNATRNNLLSFIEAAKQERSNWISSHPEPDHTRITQAWYDWNSEKDRLHKVQEQKKKDLADYDSKEPSKTIWVPITLYKCKLSASLTGTPPAGATSSDTVNVSLTAGKYKAAVTLSMGSTSGSATSAHESEDKPETATLSLTSYEGKQSTSIGEGTWTSNTLNLRLN